MQTFKFTISLLTFRRAINCFEISRDFQASW